MAAWSFAEEEEAMRGLSHCVLPVKRLWKNHAWVLGSHWQSQPSSSPEGGGSWGSGGPSWPGSSVAWLAELSSISPSSSSSWELASSTFGSGLVGAASWETGSTTSCALAGRAGDLDLVSSAVARSGDDGALMAMGRGKDSLSGLGICLLQW